MPAKLTTMLTKRKLNKVQRQKVLWLQAHVDRNYKRWFKRYTNLQGVEVGVKKVANEVVVDCYSIVFHVTTKSTKVKRKVPQHLPILDEKRHRVRIPTDIIEAGAIRLQGIKMGDSVQNAHDNLIGTISVYFRNPRGLFFCSNMHVLAPRLLNRGILHYDRRSGDPIEQVLLFDESLTATANLLRGQFNGIDIAFGRIDNPLVPQVIELLIKSAGVMRGLLDLNEGNAKAAQLSFCGRTSGLQPCQAEVLRAVKATAFENIFLTNLIKLNLCTQDGDSGAPVFDQNNRIVGIVIGRDNQNSYAMHINDIIQFFQNSNF